MSPLGLGIPIYSMFHIAGHLASYWMVIRRYRVLLMTMVIQTKNSIMDIDYYSNDNLLDQVSS